MRYSYDIFDTCLLRKCGSPDNFLDYLSTRAFRDFPTENERQDFICHRLSAECAVSNNGTGTLQEIYNAFHFDNPKLRSRDELYRIELQCERDMLVPSFSIQAEIDSLHKAGEKVIFISDMYLPGAFLQERLSYFKLFKEGDKIFVSCDVRKTKSSGELYEFISRTENIRYKEWTHRGDNTLADVKIPESLGIKTRRVSHDFSFYQNDWKKSEFTLQYKVKSAAAGLSRAVFHSNPYSTHSAFVTDIIAPFYASWTYRVLSDACSRGIERLFFCARDGYQQFLIAQVLQKELFPDIECKYLYISRQALDHEDDAAKLKYLEQEGLACHGKAAIVDMRSQGRTQFIINRMLKENGYNEVRGYYFEIFPCQEIKYDLDYTAEANKIYSLRNNNLSTIFDFSLEGPLYEIYFSMNNSPKTIGYRENHGSVTPIFGDKDMKEDCWIENVGHWMEIHSKLLLDYTEGYVKTGLFRYSDIIFEDVAIFSLNDFFTNPRKEYLQALTGFHCYDRGLPYVTDSGLFDFFVSRGRNSIWRDGTAAFLLPDVLYRLYKKILESRKMNRGK